MASVVYVKRLSRRSLQLPLSIFVLLLFWTVTQVEALGSCQLPEAWRGSWFQSGFDTIHINSSTIDVKGKCIESDGNYFLFEDRVENCYRCLFIVQKHNNVLQYKESYCENHGTLENLCLLIPGDAQQYSMFRRDAQPIECPFRGSFTFTYSRGHGECRSPVSRLDTCTEPWRLFFRYQACPDVQGTESSEEQLECLAGWKDGSLRYLMGRLQHQSATSDEDRYRCFVYEKLTTTASGPNRDPQRPTALLAQSGDATCSGLTSPSEGSRTLKLSRVETENRRCRYPSWLLAHSHWQTLDGRWMYNLHKNTTLRVSNNTNHGTSTTNNIDARHEQRATCHSVVDLSETTARVVAHLSQGCHTGYVCMVFYQRSLHVVEFQAGDASPAPEEACSPYYFNPVPGHYTTLISSSRQMVACPMDGKFVTMGLKDTPHSASTRPCDAFNNDLTSMTTSNNNIFLNDDLRYRASTIASGCSSPDTIDIYRECNRDPNNGYVCRSSWDDDHNDKTKFLIVTPLHHSQRHDAPKRLCLAITSHSHSVKPSLWQSQQGVNTWEWIVSSETCVRPYARDRMATHGMHSTHLSHNAHNLHITQDSTNMISNSAAVFNVTSAGQCTGVEAAILDSRKLYPSPSKASLSRPMKWACWILLFTVRWR